MRKPIQVIALLAAFAAAGIHAPAAPEIKVLTVDLSRAYNGFWKAQENEAGLLKSKERAEQEIAVMEKEFQEIVDAYKAKVEEVNNPMFTPDAQERAKVEAQRKMQEVEEKQQQVRRFIADNERIIGDRRKTQMGVALTEIRKAVLEVRERHGATLVFEVSGPTGFGVPAVIYADPGFDITDEVLAVLNKDKPAAPAAPAAPKP